MLGPKVNVFIHILQAGVPKCGSTDLFMRLISHQQVRFKLNSKTIVQHYLKNNSPSLETLHRLAIYRHIYYVDEKITHYIAKENINKYHKDNFIKININNNSQEHTYWQLELSSHCKI